jgi:hypothetical protein
MRERNPSAQAHGVPGREEGSNSAPQMGIRESMASLPASMQWVMTEWTGKALPGQVPPFRWTPTMRFVVTIAMLMAGVGITLTSLRLGGAALLGIPIGWLLTVSAMRSFQVVYLHHASHGKFSEWLGDLLSLSIWIQPLQEYRAAHRIHHQRTATKDDEDLALLVLLGMLPGLSRREYWALLIKSLVSWRFHGLYAWYRLEVNFGGRWKRAVSASIWTAVMAGIGLWTGCFWEILIAWLIPAWPLFHMAGLLSLLTEHTWVRQEGNGISAKETISRMTSGRYFGERAPAQGAAWWVWAGWWFRMLGLHLPTKLLVVQGDQHSHDWHHRVPKGDWENAAYARMESEGADIRGGWPPYAEVWGLSDALNSTFDALGSLSKSSELGMPSTYLSVRDALTEM